MTRPCSSSTMRSGAAVIDVLGLALALELDAQAQLVLRIRVCESASS